MSIASPIVPAVIPQSYADLVEQVETVRGVPEIHVDVVDGKFVPFVSWPYGDMDDVSVAHGLLERFSLEVDLMVENPMVAASAWLKAGADQLVFHIETISSERLQVFVHEQAVTVGVAISSATPLEKLYPYIPFVDYVQVMGIAQIGAQGQPFDESVIKRVNALAALYPHLPLSIDGSVNKETLVQLKTLPIQRFIVGSAIMKQTNPKEAYAELTKLVQS